MIASRATRPAILAGILAACALIAPSSAGAATFTVTNTLDSGVGSLRAAITAANAAGGADTVDATGVAGTIELATQLPNLSAVTINGPAANQLTVRRANAASDFPVFTNDAGVTSVIRGVSVANGIGLAGGVLNAGTLTLERVAVANNEAVTSAGGGGILNGSGATLTVVRSTVNGNRTSSGAGGGISNAGTLTVDTSTVTGNTAIDGFGGRGGGIQTAGSGTTTIVDSTIAANTGSINANLNVSSGGSLTIGSTIVSDPSGGGTNCDATAGAINTDGGNITHPGNTCQFLSGISGIDKTNTNPQLGALADNGGPTRTMAITAASPALDWGRSGSSSDQRGMTRPVDYMGAINNDGAFFGTDSGAFEVQAPPPDPVVTNTDDAGAGSLRAAITDANATAGLDTITFAPGVGGTIDLQSQLPLILGETTIVGPGADELTVRRDSGPSYRVLSVEANGPVLVSGLTLANGTSSQGGGIRAGSDELTLRGMAIRDNSATGQGGGIEITGDHVTIEDSEVSGNTTAGVDGGAGIHVQSVGSVTISNSTISGNLARGGDSAGGIMSRSPATTIEGSTIAGNRNDEPTGAANLIQSGSSAPRVMSLKSTIVADALGGRPNCLVSGTGEIGSQGQNLSSDATCDLDAETDKPSTNPQLSALAQNGGPTATMALAPSSPGIDQGAASGSSDQRGLGRTVDFPLANADGGNGSDIGAFELQASEVPAVGVSVTGGPNGETTIRRPTFSFTAANHTAVECSITSGAAAFGPCSGASSHTLPVDLADGSYTFSVQATNALGQQATATRAFSVVTTSGTPPPTTDPGTGSPPSTTDPGTGSTPPPNSEPDTTITKAKVIAKKRRAKFEFEGSGGTAPVKFECKLDRKPFKSCTSPVNFKRLKPGKHKFFVRAIDAAGRTDPTPASKKFKLER